MTIKRSHVTPAEDMRVTFDMGDGDTIEIRQEDGHLYIHGTGVSPKAIAVIGQSSNSLKIRLVRP